MQMEGEYQADPHIEGLFGTLPEYTELELDTFNFGQDSVLGALII
jgi:hypothetical protein